MPRLTPESPSCAPDPSVAVPKVQAVNAVARSPINAVCTSPAPAAMSNVTMSWYHLFSVERSPLFVWYAVDVVARATEILRSAVENSVIRCPMFRLRTMTRFAVNVEICSQNSHVHAGREEIAAVDVTSSRSVVFANVKAIGRYVVYSKMTSYTQRSAAIVSEPAPLRLMLP